MKRKTGYIIGLAIIIGIVFYISAISRHGFTGARGIFSPIVMLVRNVGLTFSGWGEFFNSRDYLRSENQRLNEQVKDLIEQIGDAEKSNTENADLKALLKYSETEKSSPIISRVIGNAKDPFREVIFIDRGLQEGVRMGAPILARGVLAGIVIKVIDHSSMVLMISDQTSKLPAKILGKEDAVGILEGHGLLYHLTLLPRNSKVAVGDIVVSENLGVTLPRGLPIGTVTAIVDNNEDPFKTAIVEPLAELDNISFVSVLRVIDASIYE